MNQQISSFQINVNFYQCSQGITPVEEVEQIIPIQIIIIFTSDYDHTRAIWRPDGLIFGILVAKMTNQAPLYLE